MALLQIAEPGQTPQPHQRRLAVGIDLGTTNSLVASVRSGLAEPLADEQGRLLLPSAVRYLADRIEVIIRFLAVLELYKQGAIEIDQPERFGDIEVLWTADDSFDTDAILIDAYEG